MNREAVLEVKGGYCNSKLRSLLFVSTCKPKSYLFRVFQVGRAIRQGRGGLTSGSDSGAGDRRHSADNCGTRQQAT